MLSRLNNFESYLNTIGIQIECGARASRLRLVMREHKKRPYFFESFLSIAFFFRLWYFMGQLLQSLEVR